MAARDELATGLQAAAALLTDSGLRFTTHCRGGFSTLPEGRQRRAAIDDNRVAIVSDTSAMSASGLARRPRGSCCTLFGRKINFRAMGTTASICCSSPCSSCQIASAASTRFSRGIFFQSNDGRTGAMGPSYT